MIEIFLKVEKIKKERDGLDFRGAFPGAVRRAPLACYWLFYMYYSDAMEFLSERFAREKRPLVGERER